MGINNQINKCVGVKLIYNHTVDRYSVTLEIIIYWGKLMRLHHIPLWFYDQSTKLVNINIFYKWHEKWFSFSDLTDMKKGKVKV